MKFKSSNSTAGITLGTETFKVEGGIIEVPDDTPVEVMEAFGFVRHTEPMTEEEIAQAAADAKSAAAADATRIASEQAQVEKRNAEEAKLKDIENDVLARLQNDAEMTIKAVETEKAAREAALEDNADANGSAKKVKKAKPQDDSPAAVEVAAVEVPAVEVPAAEAEVQ